MPCARLKLAKGRARAADALVALFDTCVYNHRVTEFKCTCVCMCVFMCVCVSVCVCECACVYVFIYS